MNVFYVAAKFALTPLFEIVRNCMPSEKPTSIREIFGQIRKAAQNTETVSLELIVQVTGRRSFGSMLLMAGIITLTPLIGDIPGVPTLMGIVTFLVAIQMLLKRKKLWLPAFLLNRSVDSEKLVNALQKMYKPAGFIDRYLKPRLTFLVEGLMIKAIAGMCIVIALAMPVMEFIPFSANIAGILLTTLGLSVITRDGLPILVGFSLAILIGGIILFQGM